MTPEVEEFCNYLFELIERKDQQIYELQYELETLLSADNELFNAASDRIDELKIKCSELIEALRTSLDYLEKIPLQMTSTQTQKVVREFVFVPRKEIQNMNSEKSLG
jgi:hypothetical protein